MDPAAGAWELSLTHSNIGDGLGLRSDEGSSEGCCFADYADPGTHPLQAVGGEVSSTGGQTEYGSIEAIASHRAERVVFETTGEMVPGAVAELASR